MYFHLGNCFIFFQKAYITNIVSMTQELYYCIYFLDQKIAFASTYLASSEAKYLIVEIFPNFS